LKFPPLAIPAMALLQQHDARRDIVIEPASRRASIEARGRSELRAFGTGGVRNWGQSACWSVCLSVCHTSELCTNGWSDRDAVWVKDSGGTKEPCIRWGSRSPMERGNFEGEGASPCKV